MKKAVFVFIALLSGFVKLHAQQRELGKVTVLELAQKQSKSDPGAAAEVIFETGDVDIHFLGQGFESTMTVCVKIKIYNKDGFEFANRRIFYSTDRSGESVSISDAATYNLVEGKIVKTPLKKDGIFTQKITKNIGLKTMTLPDVHEGSIIEYRYERRMGGVLTPPKWNFQETIPVCYSEYKVRIPQYLIFNTRQKGWIFPKVTEKRQGRNDYEETQTTYTAINVPAIKDERYVTNIENYTSGIMYELAAYNLPGRYNNFYDNLAGDWETINKKLYEHEDFGKELVKKGFFETAVDSVVKGLSSRDEIVNAVFTLAQKKVTWNKSRGFVCEDGIKAAFKQHSGNAADVNLLLTAMLRYLQINAHPVLISTQQNGMVFFPSLSAFDFVIVGIETNTGTILLDATNEFASPNILPIRDLNWVGRLMRSGGTSAEIDLLPTKMSKSTTIINSNLLATGAIEGKARKQYTGHEALSLREKIAETNQDSYLEKVENEYGGIEIGEFELQNKSEIARPLTELFDFKINTGIELIGDKIYFKPLLFCLESENPFKQEKREYPVDFGYPVQKKSMVSVTIPQGYVVESLPESVSISSEGKICIFNYAIAQKENTVQVNTTIDITNSLIPPNLYQMLKVFYQQIVEKQLESVVLKKV